eukprot:CAMPEP_0175355960 /NCGR_PEP_ID=MMETSP0095-20121207/13734_1 /TAXON_ID=311494 /ORGANISM="Alexandrium monilatum, Strain CCMP3105" /LENGTH=85 /DNA_ID=CAMNT_0016653639 /DNA_START=79 /DNA_END=332 /DNA_ORIENTATION=+
MHPHLNCKFLQSARASEDTVRDGRTILDTSVEPWKVRMHMPTKCVSLSRPALGCPVRNKPGTTSGRREHTHHMPDTAGHSGHNCR